jgi:hypothetical protein
VGQGTPTVSLDRLTFASTPLQINPASDPDTVRFVWKFGDGNSKNEHRYKAKGIKELLKNSTKVMFGQETLADWSEKIHKNDYDQDAA